MKAVYYMILLVTSVSFSCQKAQFKSYKALDSMINVSGRTDVSENNEVILIGSASSVEIHFSGDSCIVLLRNNNPAKLHNYYSYEINGKDYGRFRIDGDDLKEIVIKPDQYEERHVLKIIKSTEASNGYINFAGVICEKIHQVPRNNRKKIEFIGNSITCGMGNDARQVPCNSAEWFDQHNAYYAYGSIVARELDIDFMLSSVSGIGIYRNWDVEDGPTMPMVYENMYLNTEISKKWDFSRFTPDIVSICLGTNDFSDGDGITPRSAFNPEKFVANYIAFIDKVLTYYPNTQIALLASPMLSGEKASILLACLKQVATHFEAKGTKPFALFEFSNIVPHGCDYHPDIEDHFLMAKQLMPFYTELLNR
jgi:hypothetical protein